MNHKFFATGQFDIDGVEIKCGDRVEYYQYKKSYTETHRLNQYNDTVPICIHDQKKVPEEERTTFGIVAYNPKKSGFFVNLDDYPLNSFNREVPLYIANLNSNNSLHICTILKIVKMMKVVTK